MAIGCIQALSCNNNTCPVGITTHDPKLTKGLDIELKSERVKNYVSNLLHDHEEILASLGKRNYSELSEDVLTLELEKLVDRIKKNRRTETLNELQKNIVEAEKSQNKEELMKLLALQQELLSS